MGETTCLMQPFSYAAGFSNDANEQGNPIHALGQSVSFGRFMSDQSLSWEKWSTFSSNRYVEEAEKFSRPGSVAQKKAFFEAHYRNLAARKAAALLEQANAAANSVPEPESEGEIPDNTAQDSQTVTTNPNDAVDHQQAVHVPQQVQGSEEVHVPQVNAEGRLGADDDSHCNSNVEMDKSENGKVEEFDSLAKNQAHVENCVEVEALNQLGNAGNRKEVQDSEFSVSKQMEKTVLKDFILNKDDSASTSKKKPAVSSSKSLVFCKASKQPLTPAKPAASLRKKKENIATPISKKYAIDLVDRKKPTPKSTHKSMSFTPVREINRITSSIIRKIDNSRVGCNSKASKDCPTPSRTPLMVSVFEESIHPLATPQSEKGRAKTPLHPSASGSRTVRSKWHFLPTDCSKFMPSSRNKSRSPSLPVPFSLRTEERAARRKEKLEEKFNPNQAQKVQLQATLKEKAETEIKRLRQTLCFKARPLPEFYKQRVTPNNQIEKVPLTHSQSPKLGRKSTPTAVQGTSQLPRQSSSKNTASKNVIIKNSQNPRSLASRLKTTAHENSSPNIQHE